MIDINGAIIGITLESGIDINVTVEPVNADIDGHLASTGVYELSSGDVTGELGSIAFSLEDSYEWIYNGDILSDTEVEQIVEFIQKDNDTIHSFFFKQTVGGTEHDYRVTENEGHFEVEKDGHYLCEIQNNEEWECISSPPVDDETLKLIIDEIKKRYS